MEMLPLLFEVAQPPLEVVQAPLEMALVVQGVRLHYLQGWRLVSSCLGEDGSEAFDGEQLCVRAVRCDVRPDGFGQSVEAVDDTVFGRQNWACLCWMLENDCVVDNDMLGGVFNNFVALVML